VSWPRALAGVVVAVLIGLAFAGGTALGRGQSRRHVLWPASQIQSLKAASVIIRVKQISTEIPALAPAVLPKPKPVATYVAPQSSYTPPATYYTPEPYGGGGSGGITASGTS
jgi:hypothetical protein